MNVFVRCWADSPMRAHLARAVVERLRQEVGVRDLRVIVCTESVEYHGHFYDAWAGRLLPLVAEDFHLNSKRTAALEAESEYLIIVDDDQLPLYRDWVGYAVSLTKRFPEYAAIAGWSVTNEVPRPESLIAESDSIGCPMIVRRSALLDATSEPIDNPQRADTILTGRLQRHGKTGIARNWRYNHLGMGYSQVIPQHWMPECPA